MTAGSMGRAWAVLGLSVLAVLLLSLPALIALGVAPSNGAVFAWLAASLAAVSGGGKLAAVIWGVASQLLAPPEPGATPSPIQ